MTVGGTRRDPLGMEGHASDAAVPDTVRSRLYFLDMLRIVAFTSVLIGHKFQPALQGVAEDFHQPAWVRLLVGLALPFSEGGAFGVMVFFLVSGYIITQVVLREAPGVFILKRVFRIYPLYIFACLLEWGLAAWQGHEQGLSWTIRIAQWLLIGDWVGAPYALGAVEWTLRVELLFYAFMALVARLGLLAQPARAVLLYGVVAVGLYVVAPWPQHAGWSDGYVNLYFPMLLMGSCVYLAQQGAWRLRVGAAVTVAYMLTLSVIHTAQIQPRWSGHHFMQLALALFVLTWLGRAHIRLGGFGIWLSDLSYAVYLMHNWLWDTLKRLALEWATLPWVVNGLVLVQLFAFCWLAVQLIERPGVRLGKFLASHWQHRFAAPVAMG